MNTNHDEKLINKTYKEFKVQNITSNAMKLKLIHEVKTIMNASLPNIVVSSYLSDFFENTSHCSRRFAYLSAEIIVILLC